MGVQGQKDMNKAGSLVEMARRPAELLLLLGLPSTSQYPVTSKSCQVSNRGIGGWERVAVKQHGLYRWLQLLSLILSISR